MIFFALFMAELKSTTKKLFLTCFLERQTTEEHRSLKVNYVFSTKTDIGIARWSLRILNTHQ